MKKYFFIAIFVFLPLLLLAQEKPQTNPTIDSLKNRLKSVSSQERPSTLNELALAFGRISLDTTLKYAQQALDLALQNNNIEQEEQAHYIIGTAYYYKGEYENALESWERRLEINKQQGDKEKIAESLLGVGVLYKDMGKYDVSIEKYQDAVKIQEEIGDKPGMARTFGNIGNIYYYFGENYDKAFEYYQRSLDISREIEDLPGIANTLNSIGNVYYQKEQYKKAEENFKDALQINKKIGNKAGIATTMNSLGRNHARLGNFQQAFDLCTQAAEIHKERGNIKQYAFALRDIGGVLFEWGRYDQALDYYAESIEIVKKLNLKKELVDFYENISDVYAAKNNYSQALDFYKKRSQLKDSIFSEESQKKIAELETKFKTQEKEKQLVEQEAELLRRRNFLYVLVGGVVLLVLLAFWLFNRFMLKKKANEELAARNQEILKQKDKIEHQRDEIERQHAIVSKQKKEITDSIVYARRIQSAVLPPSEFINELLPENFILFKPRDIVSGDFYWMTQKDSQIVIAAADCTGHGVPGAFMSMLGVAFLNEIVNKMDDLQAHLILNQLRAHVKDSLRQTGKQDEAKDGMDIALCIIDKKRMKMQFAGAYNPLYLIRKISESPIPIDIEEKQLKRKTRVMQDESGYELIEVKADKMPIGIYIKERASFSSQTVDIEPGNTFYIFSDGYIDQFGGLEGRKFMSKRFKQLLLDMQDKTMHEQRQVLNQTMEEWKKDHGQVDDMIVIGVRI